MKWLSRVQLFIAPWTIAYQAPLSMRFSRQEYWSGLPLPSLADLPNPGIEPRSPTLQADTLPSEPPGKPHTLSKNKIIFLFCSHNFIAKVCLNELNLNFPFYIGQQEYQSFKWNTHSHTKWQIYHKSPPRWLVRNPKHLPKTNHPQWYLNIRTNWQNAQIALQGQEEFSTSSPYQHQLARMPEKH